MYREDDFYLGITNIYPFIDSREDYERESGLSWYLQVDAEGNIRDCQHKLNKEDIRRLIAAYEKVIKISTEIKQRKREDDNG